MNFRQILFSETRRARGNRKRAESLTTPPPASYRRVYRPLGLSSRSALSVPSLLLGSSSSSPMIASLALSISPLSSSCSLSGCPVLSCTVGEVPLCTSPGGACGGVPEGTSSASGPPSSLGGIPSVLGGTSPDLGGIPPSSIPAALGGGASSVVGGTSPDTPSMGIAVPSGRSPVGVGSAVGCCAP